MSRSIVVIACLLTALLPHAGGAQTTVPPEPAAGVAVSRGSDHEELVDVNAIDPETFEAVAAEVPEGRAPTIDGVLDEEVWQLAPVSGRFIQREPRFGAVASERTEFRILYDRKFIYFGIWAYDSDPSGIRASELKRDSGLRKGDQIKITIDTFHDHRNAFYFSTNPLGALKDANSVENGRAVNYDWNAVWRCRVSRDSRGWYVEIAIPLSQLRFRTAVAETVWGLNVCRIIMRKNEEAYWVPFPREWGSLGFARMSHAGVLRGLRGISARRRFEALPYIAPRVARDYDAGTPLTGKAEVGGDLRVGVTKDLTADITANTDFAQVEADQEIVNLERFPISFPEKRQFFTESAGIFEFGSSGSSLLGDGGGGGGSGRGLIPLFYSRRVGLEDGHEIPILGGGKLTGRAGSYSIGLMNITTGKARYDTDEGPVDVPRQNFTAFRIKRPVLAQSSIGAIVLNRDGASENRSAGVDGAFTLGRNTVLTTVLAKTFTPGTRGRDAAGALDFDWKTDRFNAGATYLDIQERFNAGMGFIRRTDIRNMAVSAGWTPRPRWPGVRQFQSRGVVEYFENHSGRVESRNYRLSLDLNRQDGSNVSLDFEKNFDFLPEEWTLGEATLAVAGYQWNEYRTGFSTNQSRRVYGGLNVGWGGYYSGDRQTYRANLNVVPRDTLLLETNYTRNHIAFAGVRPYVTNTLNARISYSFSPDLFVKTFVQYNDDRKLASVNVLLWYIYRPGSDFYIVYNNGWETGLPGGGYRVRNRSLAVKMTYWLNR